MRTGQITQANSSKNMPMIQWGNQWVAPGDPNYDDYFARLQAAGREYDLKKKAKAKNAELQKKEADAKAGNQQDGKPDKGWTDHLHQLARNGSEDATRRLNEIAPENNPTIAAANKGDVHARNLIQGEYKQHLKPLSETNPGQYWDSANDKRFHTLIKEDEQRRKENLAKIEQAQEQARRGKSLIPKDKLPQLDPISGPTSPNPEKSQGVFRKDESGKVRYYGQANASQETAPKPRDTYTGMDGRTYKRPNTGMR